MKASLMRRNFPFTLGTAALVFALAACSRTPQGGQPARARAGWPPCGVREQAARAKTSAAVPSVNGKLRRIRDAFIGVSISRQAGFQLAGGEKGLSRMKNSVAPG